MARKFFPETADSIPASPPHPAGTEYRVSVGTEDWDGLFVPVVKVQMMYDGIVAGRKSPSYPVNADDHDRVHRLINKLLAKGQRTR